MRILKALLAAVIVVVSLAGGVIVAAVVAVVGLIAYGVMRLQGKKGSPATFSASFSTRRNAAAAARKKSAPAGTGDIIDVEATDVAATPVERLPENHSASR